MTNGEREALVAGILSTIEVTPAEHHPAAMLPWARTALKAASMVDSDLEVLYRDLLMFAESAVIEIDNLTRGSSSDKGARQAIAWRNRFEQLASRRSL